MFETDKQMYFGASVSTINKAKELRKRMTNSETLLWNQLKGKRICNVRFRRQHPIDIFIADFFCYSALLVVEVDGETHNYQENYDINRTAELERFGVEVIRFTNQEVETDLEKVLNKIEEKVSNRMKLL
ncbi:very-short-patch-repair endonuclease [Natronoflexus pectinivorans]|uniref:Very-short-patch-repair endonuclease n=2 Tax=Natronoflexus pectinivorans TaxID=682526 RepID=A0A4R2GKF6_9BACT|nr:very-short-patch-repair endonuclease [Natronoflexus pectinivorans]